MTTEVSAPGSVPDHELTELERSRYAALNSYLRQCGPVDPSEPATTALPSADFPEPGHEQDPGASTP